VRLSRVVFTAALVTATASAAPAWATPRPLPFTYTADTLGQGETELEQYTDLTPVNGINASTGFPVKYLATQFQTEFEHGITDSLELGLYVAFQPVPANIDNAATLTEGTGFKERLRYRLADPGAWPIDVALYGELVEFETEFEVEAKVILERRFGNLRIAANAWAEREFYYAGDVEDWVLNPTIGATYQVSPHVHPGVEYWMRVEFPSDNPNPRPFSIGPNQYLGPTLMFEFGKFWWSTGLYARLNNIGRTPLPSSDSGSQSVPDDYGQSWVRTVIGLEL
jgi:hypothetical protein